MSRTPFDAITDWPTVLREVIDKPDSHPEIAAIQPQATTAEGILSALFWVLGPFAKSALADAALGLVETGTPAQVSAVYALGLEHAPNAAARIGAILQARRGALSDAAVDALIDSGLQQDARDPVLVSAIEREAQARGWRMLHLMAPHRPDWVAAHLELVPTATDPEGKQLARIVDRTKAPDLPALVDAIARAGTSYVTRLVDGMKPWPDKARQRVAPVLHANAAFNTTP